MLLSQPFESIQVRLADVVQRQQPSQLLRIFNLVKDSLKDSTDDSGGFFTGTGFSADVGGTWSDLVQEFFICTEIYTEKKKR